MLSATGNEQKTVPQYITLFGKDTDLEGTLRTKHDTHVSGWLVGTLEVEGKVVIAEEGVVEGKIIAENVEIEGQVEGEIDVQDRAVLRRTSQTEVKITADRLVIEEGAQFTGECEMDTTGLEKTEVTGEEKRENEETSQDGLELA